MTALHRFPGQRPSLLRSAVLIACLGMGLAACEGGPPGMGMGRGQPPPQAAEERPSPVLLAAVARGTIQGQIRAASTIEAELQVTVHAESAGRITMLDLEEGDVVTEGDVLARIRRDA